MKITREDIGKKIVYRDIGTPFLSEGTIRDISPSSRYVNIDYTWHNIDELEYEVIE